MCGLAGIIGPPNSSAEQLAATATAMADELVHRGPDGSGVTVVGNRIALGHRRLAVIDRGATGNQPMASRSGRWTVLFNGEIYNHKTLRAELAQHGVTFRGHGDTETLVESIDRWGLTAALQRCTGMFAIAAWDHSRESLHLARDRHGEKPLYWWHDGERFAFASELRALRAVPDLRLCVDPAAATALLRWSFIPHPHTIYQNVQQLAPGHIVEADLRQRQLSPRVTTWWALDEVIERALDERSNPTLDQAADELDSVLGASVARTLESDVALGVFLSGGIDSSLVAALAQRSLPAGDLTTITVSLPTDATSAGFDEAPHAAAVARHLGSNHHVLDVSARSAFDLIPRLPAIWDEPFADPSMVPTALLCRAAGEIVTVCLGGDGGDELFGGYNRHVLGARIDRRVARLPTFGRSALARAVLAPPPSAVDSLGAVAARIAPSRTPRNLGDKAQKLGALLGGGEAAWPALAGIWPQEVLSPAPHQPATPTIRRSLAGTEALMAMDTAVVLPDNMMVKVDRAAMAASLEVRSPFLDSAVFDWAWRQPLSVKVRGTTGKLVVRELAARLLPPHIATRPKMGFDPPLGSWLRRELRPWAHDLLASSRAVEEGWIDRSVLDDTWAQHLRGRRNWDYRLWAVLMLDSWLEAHHPCGS